MSYSSVPRHRGMVFDTHRNNFYYDALTQYVTPETIVLDLGSGLGIHGLLAAKLGAKQVYMVEPEDIISVSKQIAKSNGLGDNIQFFRGKIEDVDLPSPVDIITSVFTGNFLLNEDLLPSLFYAREKYLNSNGILIPDRGIMQAVPVFLPELYAEEIDAWSEPQWEIDFSPVKTYASNTLFYRQKELADVKFLAEPVSLLEINFNSAVDTHCEVELDVTVKTAGLCHGWAGWFQMKLGDSWLSTSPHEPETHWSPAFLPLDPALELEEGEEIRFRLLRPSFGDWSWFVQTARTEQQHSTFLSSSLSLDTVKKAALDYVPQINEEGEIASFVLSQVDGKQTTRQIVQSLRTQYPQKYSQEAALKLVQGLVKWYA